MLVFGKRHQQSHLSYSSSACSTSTSSSTTMANTTTMSMSMASLEARDLLGCLLAIVATLALFKHLLAPAKKKSASPAKSLPQPSGLPIIGNLHQIGGLPHVSLAELAAKHAAPLMMLRFGSVRTLVVSSAEATRAIFEHNDRVMSGRPTLYAGARLSHGQQAMTFAPAEGAFWRGARRACLGELLGAPRVRGFRNVRESQAAVLVDTVADMSKTGSPVNLSHLLLATSSKIVRRIAFGEAGEDSIEARVVPILKESQSLLSAFWVIDYLPWLGWLDALRGLRGRLERNFLELDEFCERIIEGHIKKRNTSSSSSSASEDLVDVLLRLHVNPAHQSAFGSRDQVKGILTEMFIAGTDTSTAALEWTMTELINNPDVLAKAQQEVRTVVGDRDMVRESDLPRLTYLNLVVKESLRLHPPAPLLVPRETTEPCTVQGCEIPAKTMVIVNAKAIGADPKAWGEDVAEFVPERHERNDEAADASEFRPWHDNFNLVPFGIRRRSCPGMHFATAVVELVLANLLFSFEWRAPLGVVDVEEVNGLTVHRKNPLVLLAKRRSVQK